MHREKYLDSLRGIAILLVLVTHSWDYIPETFGKLFYAIIGEGVRGVQLFFMVSALTLFLSFERSNFTLEKNKTITYGVKRFFRIAPLFYLVMIFSFIIHSLNTSFFPELSYNFLSVTSSLFFVNGLFNSFSVVPLQWSLAVEMLFYIIVPFLFVKITSLRKAVILYCSYVIAYVLFFIGIIYNLSLHENIHNVFIKNYFLFYCSLPFQFPIFILGIISYYLLKETPSKALKTTFGLFTFTSIVLAIYAIIFKKLGAGIQISNISPRIYLETITFIPLIYFMSTGKIKIFRNYFFEFFGRISYSVYLLHIFLYLFAAKVLFHFYGQKVNNKYEVLMYLLIITLILSGLVGHVVQKYIETYFINFGKRFYKK